MKLYVDLATLQFIEGPGIRSTLSQLRFKRGDAAKLEVAFLTDGLTATFIGNPGTLQVTFGAKLRNGFGGEYIISSSVWMMPDPESTAPVYTCSPSFNTEQLNTALGLDEEAGQELDEIMLMGELTWREGTGDPTSTRTILIVVENDVNRGTEGVPTDADPAYPTAEFIAALYVPAAPYSVPAPLAPGATWTPDLDNGRHQRIQFTTAAGTRTIAPPTHPVDGKEIELLIATGSDATQTLKFGEAILIPSRSTDDWYAGVALENLMLYTAVLKYDARNSGTWKLMSFVGGFINQEL